MRAQTGRARRRGPPRPTWYWQSWRIRGQARTWPRCMARARAPPCGELSRVARACRRRTATPGASGLPWRTRASSRPRACCSARAAGRALELCHRGPGLSGKICAEKGGGQASSGHPDPPHSPGGREEGAVDWGRGPGQQARESACGPVHTRACARVSARKRHICSAAPITGPGEPRPWARVGGQAGGRGGGGAGRGRGHPYLQEQASQVVLRAQHSHLRHGAGPALARRLLRAAFGFRRLRAICRKGGAASARGPPTCFTGTLPTKASRPQRNSSRALLRALARAPEAYEVQSPLTRGRGGICSLAAVHGDSGGCGYLAGRAGRL